MYLFYIKICAIRNKASLLRMLRNVCDSLALGLAGCRLLATGKSTGTTPVHSYPLGQPIISISQPPIVTDHFSLTDLEPVRP
jgi:hypothetical protein